MSNNPERPLRIPEVIEQVRAELAEAIRRHRESGREPMLALKKVTLEIGFAVSTEQNLDSELKASIWVLDFKLGAGKGRKIDHAHKITIEMETLGPILSPGIALAPRGPLLAASDSPAPPFRDFPVAPALKPASTTKPPRREPRR